MSQEFAELLLFALAALLTGLLTFVADVLQRILNDLEPEIFARFMASLYDRAGHSPFVVILMLGAFAGSVSYLIVFGVSNPAYALGVVTLLIGMVAAKHINGPIYRRIVATPPGDAIALNNLRERLQRANNLRAALSAVGLSAMFAGLVS